ncbi:class I SAM-dependent methyltransferase [Virgisporangium aurantiacum]|uniref:Methyltransferase n=1 Tax=Virgisporangium aurantiacum TaxID=175570 RepID=A0A8J4E3U9_9ACTN|nr:class I SAM-dependent methyltransferase [Virgisporangium aurantiacum]GIJ60414.1 methyltransferase [Virgisporangium aurantiacum]
MPEPPGGLTRARLLEMMTAYKATYLLRAAVRLRVFDALAGGPADPDTVAAILRTDPRGTRVLLRALAAAGLLHVDGEEFRLPPGADELLVTGSPQYSGGVTEVAASRWEWDAMADLDDIVRHGGTRLDVNAETPGFPYWVDFATHQTFATVPGARFVADLLADWAADRDPLRILDVGCGSATFGGTLAARHPHARLTGLDWPSVLEVAGKSLGALGVADRFTPLPGDVFTADLTGPYDVVILANVMMLFDAARGTALLRRLRAHMRPGGRAVIVGFTTGDAAPVQDYHAHMLELLMLALTEGGELHSTTAYRKMLASSGFAEPTVHTSQGLPLRFVEGTAA